MASSISSKPSRLMPNIKTPGGRRGFIPRLLARRKSSPIDFVFNPANYSGASGGSGTNCTGGIAAAICGDYSIPMGRLAPVPHRDGEAIKKEIYLISNFTTNGDLRIELYYNAYDYDQSTNAMTRVVIQNLTRRTGGTAVLPCPGAGAFGDQCSSASGSVSMSYTYAGTETVSTP